MANVQKFKRATNSKVARTKDETGSVKVSITLGGKAAKGNVRGSVVIADAKVSVVQKAIEDALFG